MIHNEIITSRNNTLVKWAASLADKKGRQSARSFIAEGIKLTEEAISSGMPVSHIFLREDSRDCVLGRLGALLDESRMGSIEIYTLSASAFEKISTEKAPQGVITVIKYLDFSIIADIIYKEDFFLKTDERALALCSVRDPSNLGAVIRSASAFGVQHIILTADCADVYNPKTVRSSMGCIFKVKITIVSDLHSFVKAALDSERRVFAAELSENAVSLRDLCVKPTDIFMIGNEGHGIPSEVSSLCSGSVYIPISPGVESLNASVAAAIFMWEQS